MVEEDVRFSLPSGADSVSLRLNTIGTMSAPGTHRERWPPQRARGRAVPPSIWSDLQARDGYWCAELTADTTLESDYILFQLWLHPPRSGRLGSAHAPADR